MIVDVPALTPVITPDDELTVATPVVPLVHAPPASPLDEKVVVEPMLTVFVPLTAPESGCACTDKVLLPVVLHVLSSVTVIV